VSPVLVGTSIAVRDGRARLVPGVSALIVALAIQVGVNYANDYADFLRGADTDERVGPARAAASGAASPGAVRVAAIAAFGLAAMVGLGVSLAVDWRLLIAGAASIAAAWLYTGGPRPYGYLGLGELFVFVFFGLVATIGTVYVQELRIPPLAWIGGAATGFLATAILVLNNLRDLKTDAAAGKMTLAVRVGPAGTRLLLLAVLVLAFASAAVAALATGWPALLLPLVSAPVAVAVVGLAFRGRGPQLVAALKLAAALESIYGLLWAIGILVS
jgi:1,4-dihydroxy-2-naphthoate octaprenyltransferase